jgi:hypothetical protein
MKHPAAALLALFTALTAAAQSPAPAPSEEAGRAYGAAVTQAVLQAETLVRIEQQCPKLKSTMDYLDMVATDRKRVEAMVPDLRRTVALIVPMTTDDIIKTDGGCDADKLKARHKALQDSFTQAALGLMQGTWMPKK